MNAVLTLLATIAGCPLVDEPVRQRAAFLKNALEFSSFFDGLR